MQRFIFEEDRVAFNSSLREFLSAVLVNTDVCSWSSVRTQKLSMRHNKTVQEVTLPKPSGANMQRLILQWFFLDRVPAPLSTFGSRTVTWLAIELKLFCWLSRWPRWPSQSNMSQLAPTGNVLFFWRREGLWSRRSLILPHPRKEEGRGSAGRGGRFGGNSWLCVFCAKRSLCFCLMTQQLVSWVASWRGLESLSQKPF